VGVTCTGFSPLAESLGSLPKLEQLFLGYNAIGSVAVHALTAAFERRRRGGAAGGMEPGLRKLDLSGNLIDDDGVKVRRHY
jgi:hypothetical protein